MSAPAIKAIPATYNSITFRSRTEARWAVFFDALGIRWEYEHEGYQLPSGWYLPDFWLPEVNGGIFVEIKPERAATREEIARLVDLVEATRLSAVLFCGAPGDGAAAPGDAFDTRDGAGTILRWEEQPIYGEDDTTIIADGECSCEDWPYYFCGCRVCGKVGIQWGHKSERICRHEWSAKGWVPGPSTPAECRPTRERGASVASACQSARSRRFW